MCFFESSERKTLQQETELYSNPCGELIARPTDGQGENFVSFPLVWISFSYLESGPKNGKSFFADRMNDGKQN